VASGPSSDGPDGRAVARAFGLGTALAEPTFSARGELGRMFRLETSTGSWAVKQLFEDEVEQDASDNLDYQEAVRAAGVPMPRPHRALDGRAYAQGVRVYDWLELEPGAHPDAVTAGALLARIHAVRWPAGDAHPWFSEPVPPARWDELVAEARAAGARWAEPLARAAPELAACVTLITPPDPARLQRCHLDFNPENVLVTTAGEPVVIDWENAGAGDPRREAAATLVEFEAGGVLRGYREAGGALDGLEPSDFAMGFAVHAHLIEFYGRTWLVEPAEGGQRPRYDRWLSELLPPVITRRIVADLVEEKAA
jgi:Ser/Thr protein kinase RdoA (MazF antagonist)